MTEQRHLIELIDNMVPLLKQERYNHKVVEEICKLCLPYIPLKETTLFSYVLFSLFDELRIYIEDIVWELGKMFGPDAQDKEEERITHCFQEDFIGNLQTLKENPQNSKELRRILSAMIYKWITFDKEVLSNYG